MIDRILYYMRVKSGLTQKELGELLGSTQSTVSGYETKKSSPTFDIIQSIAEACEFEIAFIDKNNGEKITKEEIDECRGNRQK